MSNETDNSDIKSKTPSTRGSRERESLTTAELIALMPPEVHRQAEESAAAAPRMTPRMIDDLRLLVWGPAWKRPT